MRAHNFKDLSGHRFGGLIAQAFDGTRNGKTWWRCVCDCGVEKTVAYQHLAAGLVRSCGCLRRKVSAEHLRAIKTKHGACSGGTPRWYNSWAGMMDRCHNPKSLRFHRYGGRGITVCERWRDPLAFHADMGDPSIGMTIERIDNNVGYSPENCRWATKKEQNNNRATTRIISFEGKTLSAAAWAEHVGVSKETMYYRLRRWPIDRALTEPGGTYMKRGAS